MDNKIMPKHSKEASRIYCYWCFGDEDNYQFAAECICEAFCGNEWCQHKDLLDDLTTITNKTLSEDHLVGKHSYLKGYNSNVQGFSKTTDGQPCVWCHTAKAASEADCTCYKACTFIKCGQNKLSSTTSLKSGSWPEHPYGDIVSFGTKSYICSKDNQHGKLLFEWNDIKFFGDKKFELEKHSGKANQPKRLIVNCSNGAFSGPTPSYYIPTKVIDKAPECLKELTDAEYIWKAPIVIPWGESIDLAWPDGKAFPVSLSWWQKLLELVQVNAYEEVWCCCTGGHGRTGTALAILLMLTCDFKEASNKKNNISITCEAWIKEHYCERAIETNDQQGYLDYIATALYPSTEK
jgi:hypothetical protein